MRFRFCGDLDCPDWILAEINTLARMTSVKMKLICQQVSKALTDEQLDMEKVKKLTADAKFESGDVKASVAALLFVLATSARHGVDGDTLSSELQQLGLPREHAVALCRVYSDNLAGISAQLKSQSLRLNRLDDAQWRLDSVVQGDGQLGAELRLALKVTDPCAGVQDVHQINMTSKQLHMLLAELKQAAALMEFL